jgi:hypothetical protein
MAFAQGEPNCGIFGSLPSLGFSFSLFRRRFLRPGTIRSSSGHRCGRRLANLHGNRLFGSTHWPGELPLRRDLPSVLFAIVGSLWWCLITWLTLWLIGKGWTLVVTRNSLVKRNETTNPTP